MTAEAIIGLALVALGLMGGFLAWLTKVSSDVGFIRGQLVLRVENVEERIDHHSDQIDGLSVKVAKLEGA